jgi:tetratricopeptide (TPR) repeat protein
MPEQAFSYVISAYKIAINEKNDILKGRARVKMGDYYLDKRKFIQALEQYLVALKIFQKVHDTTDALSVLENIGVTNRTLRNLEPAIGYFQKANNLAIKANNRAAQADILDQIGTTYQFMGERETALNFFKQALAIAKQLGDRHAELSVKNNIGGLYLDEGKYEEGLEYYHVLIREADTSDRVFMGILYTRIAHIFDKKQEYRNSLKYNLRALSQRRKAALKEHYASSLINVAGDYYNLGKPDSGRIYIDSGLLLSHRHDWKQFVENGYGHLVQYYKRIGSPRQALDFFRLYSEIQDEINRERYRNRLEILETNQRLQQSRQSSEKLASRSNIQTLKFRYNAYLMPTVKVMAGIATIFVLVFIIQLLLTRLDRRKMQDLNVQLSHEISEREFTEAQTREREKQYKFITDNSVDFITHMDDEKNRIYASPASLKVYGYEPEEILGKSSHDLTHPDD